MSTRKILHVLTLNLLLISTLTAYEIVDFSAFPANNMIEVSWQVQDGANIQKFVLQRSVDEVSWNDVQEFSYSGDGTKYYYQDSQVMKDSEEFKTSYFYRLKIHLTDGSIETSQSIMARPKYSGIYRTWGSLKAIFR